MLVKKTNEIINIDDEKETYKKQTKLKNNYGIYVNKISEFEFIF